MGPTDLSAFLFEIASRERLAILTEIAAKPQKHSALARRLSMTGSETTRHLGRLSSAGLVARNPRGEYECTGLASVLLRGLPFFEFLAARRDYLLTHRVLGIDSAFIARIGELSRGAVVTGAYEVVAVQEAALRNVRRRIWVATEQRFERALPIFRQKATEGVDVRVIRPRTLVAQERRTGPRIHRNFAFRVLEEVPVFLAVLDDQAGISFPGPEGRLDLANMILVTDPSGYQWAADLFETLWRRTDEWGNATRTVLGSRK
jgi:predicted transcriptional regulator